MTAFVTHNDTETSLAAGLAKLGTQDITLSVTTTGNDSTGDGSVARPYRSITKALNSLPQVNFGKAWVINVGPGSFDSTGVKCPFIIFAGAPYDPSLTGPDLTGSLVIQSTTWIDYTPTTGPQSGTFTSGSGFDVTMSGATWTASDLKGKFLKITTGSWNNQFQGKYLPIFDNTADTITTAVFDAYSTLATAVFSIVDPGATIANWSGGAHCNRFQIDTFHGYSGKDKSANVRVVGFNIQSERSNINLVNSSMAFESCYSKYIEFDRGTTINEGGQLFLHHCYFKNRRTLKSSYGAITSILGSIFVDNYGSDSIFNTHASLLTFNSGYVDGVTETAFEFTNSSNIYNMTAALAYTNISSAKTGIKLSGGCSLYMTGANVTSSSGTAIMFGDPSSLKPGGNNLVFGGIIDTAVNGVVIYSANNSINLDGEINNCSGTGVKLGANYASCHNVVTVGGSTSMTSNTVDFTLDGGTTPFSLATLISDPDKKILDAPTGNIASAG